MNVLHVLHHSIPILDGYSMRSEHMIRAQQNLGIHPVVITGPQHAPYSEALEMHQGVEYYRTPPVSFPYARKLSSRPLVREALIVRALEARLTELLTRTPVDVIHAHSPSLIGLAALRAARRFGIPIVYEIRAFWEDALVDQKRIRAGSWRYRLSRGVETYLLRQVHAVIALCEGLRNDMIGRGIPAEKIAVVPNGVDPTLLQSDRPAEPLKESYQLQDSLVIGYIGSFYHFEGLALLVENFSSIKTLCAHSNVKLMLVGQGEAEASLKSLMHRLGLTPNDVILTGRVDHRTIRDYYGVMDILVYPRLRNRMTELVTPLKPLEAMALRRPVLASDVGGNRELIRDGENGRLFAADRGAALISRCVELMRNPLLREKLAAQAQSDVMQNRIWPRIIREQLKVYARLCALFLIALLCTPGAASAQETSRTRVLYNFEPPESSPSQALVYRRSYLNRYGATYLDGQSSTRFVGWDARYFGYLRLDSTQGAKGSKGSLQLTVTGGNREGRLTGSITGCGGPITSWEDSIEHRERVCAGKTNQSFFHWYLNARPDMNGRRSFPQAVGANRMSFYIKLPPVFDQSIGGRVGQVGVQHYNFHVGTYPINPATQDSRPRNEDTHYYHWIGMNGGGWIHVVLDQHPQHERDGNVDPGWNPTQRRWGYNYFDGLASFYIGDVNFTLRPTPWSVNIDEIEFYNTADTPEPQQNEETIASMAVGYYPADGHWEMNWYDAYQCETCMATYEVRWSTEPITNANFDEAFPATVTRYGPDPSGISYESLVRKQSPWGRHVWTQFYIPDDAVTYEKIYFAVKDVSAFGQHCRGENYENARCDNRNAPSAWIHTIDYYNAPVSESPLVLRQARAAFSTHVGR